MKNKQEIYRQAMIDKTNGNNGNMGSARIPVVVTHANGSKTFFAGGERARQEIEAALALAAERRENGTFPVKTKLPQGPVLIPRIFHYIWLGPNRMPERFEAYMEGWQKKHPEWRMMRWTDDNLPRMINQRTFDAAPDWSSKSDIVRYEVLLRYGGVYIDTDMECCKSIEPLLGGVEAFAAWQDNLTVNIAIIGCVPWHPFMADILGGIEHSYRTATHWKAVYRAGPDYFTQIIKARHPEVTLFPVGHFYPYHWLEAERSVKPSDVPGAYAIHHWTLTGVTGVTCSVIIPSSGDTLRLEWLLEGLCRQRATQASWDVIVVNDGKESADDALRSLVARFEGRLKIRYLFSGPPRTEFMAGVARNLGLREAHGEYIIFLDEDCIPCPDFIRLHQVSQNGGRCGCYGQRRYYPMSMVKPFAGHFDFDAMESVCWSGDWFTRNPDPAWARWYSANAGAPRSSIMEIGGFDETFSGWGNEDRDLAERLHRNGLRLKSLDSCLVVHLDHVRRSPANGLEELEAATDRRERPLVANQTKGGLPHRPSISPSNAKPRELPKPV